MIAVLVACTLAVGACGGSSGASSGSAGKADGEPEQTELNVGVLPISDLLQFYVAQEQGYFRQEGLTVNAQQSNSIAPSVVAGQLDLGWASVVTVIVAHSKNLPFKMFAGGTFLGPGHDSEAIVVASDSSIRAPSDLAGKRIAVNTLGNLNELEVKVLLDKSGVDASSVELVEVHFPEMLAALAAGRIDAAAISEPFVSQGVQDGTARVISDQPFSSFGNAPFIAGWFATSDWLDENPDTAAAFTRAIERATQYIDARPQKAAQVLPKYTEIPPPVAGKITLPDFKPTVTPRDVSPYIKESATFELIPEPFDPSEILARPSGQGED